MSETKDTIIKLLTSTNREHMGSMINYLQEGGFFTSPASTRFHGSHEGGLAEHSLGVFDLLGRFSAELLLGDTPPSPGQQQFPLSQDNIIIAALLHDVCKMGAYLASGTAFRWNRAQPKGHALLSLIRISKYITLEPIEEMMIKFHMGTYGTFEFDSYASEYPIRGDKSKSKEERYGKSLANAWYHNPIVKLMYFCDELENMGCR